MGGPKTCLPKWRRKGASKNKGPLKKVGSFPWDQKPQEPQSKKRGEGIKTKAPFKRRPNGIKGLANGISPKNPVLTRPNNNGNGNPFKNVRQKKE